MISEGPLWLNASIAEQADVPERVGAGALGAATRIRLEPIDRRGTSREPARGHVDLDGRLSHAHVVESIAMRKSDSSCGVAWIAPSQPGARVRISSLAPRYRLIDRSSRNSACCCAVIDFMASRWWSERTDADARAPRSTFAEAPDRSCACSGMQIATVPAASHAITEVRMGPVRARQVPARSHDTVTIRRRAPG